MTHSARSKKAPKNIVVIGGAKGISLGISSGPVRTF
jgi:hypothetical protein